ncbi:2OG-Fe(II) oxygenase [Bradyrhizobium vignae]|uniref:Fe2OG dioxygenase domain-containing protein n=1 Tax=Bradyrhizobium vignae TaxID=1549949 RepID=A0A2U3PXP1_9BRAD|nr:2OG-Fe(II) oxygenase [Bradyrhizobium vignae]SPP93920.1 conserved protein of unknown function [Bradyrhizobium vignae]
MTAMPSPAAGEPAPWFPATTVSEPSETVAFDELAGRYIVLFFLASAARPDVAEILAALKRREDLFDGQRALLVGITNDPDDFEKQRLQNDAGQLFLHDSTGLAATRYGLADPACVTSDTISPVAFILSPALQIIDIVHLTETTRFLDSVTSLVADLLAQPPVAQNAPVLIVPRIFDRDFCERLIQLYEAAGGREIGSIENRETIIERFDPQFRKRLDYYVSDESALRRAKELLQRRLLPMVYRAFQFPTTRIERYLVGCYDAATGGYFRAHRDNTAPVVAHRRFAVTITLNEDYEGGCLSFPEYGPQVYKAKPGDAIVFSCSLLHEVTPVTGGSRYAFLSFLYDEQSQKLRDAYSKKQADSQARL